MQTLSDAITAVKAGRNQEARNILTGILANDPQNVSALLWMTQVAETINERREYLRRVLAIDPNNEPAKKGLAMLGETDEAPPWMTQQVDTKPSPGVKRPGNEAAAANTLTAKPVQKTSQENPLEKTTQTGLTIKPKYIAVIGGIAMIVGSMMPWGVVSSILGTVNHMGTDVDGKYTLAIGVIVVLAAILAKETPGKPGSALAGIFALIGGILAILDFNEISQIVGYESGVVVSVGAGMYVLIIGAVFGTIGGFMRNPQ